MARKSTAKKITAGVEVVEIKKPVLEKPTVVKCISPFFDSFAGVVRGANEQGQVTRERLAQIRAAEEAQNIKLIEVL